MSGMWRALSGRDYRIWFVGAFVSNIGTWMATTSQNWVVLTELTNNDAFAVGVSLALQFIPVIVLLPFTGYVTDRFDRRKALFVTQGSQLFLSLALGLLLLLGHAQLWHLYLFALLIGVVSAFDLPIRQTFISDLAASYHTSNAVGLNSASFNVARLLGPALAGVLIAVIGSGWVFIVNAASFAAVLVSLMMLRTRPKMAPKSTESSRKQFIAGFSYLRTRSDLIVLFVIAGIVGAFGMNFAIFASTMAVEFGKGSSEYGLLSSILAIGSLTGALLSARRDRARIRIIIAATALFSVSTLIAGFMPDFSSFALSNILIGFASVTFLTTANSYTQTTTPEHVRGRVMALYFAILTGTTPIGSPIIGAIANTFGPRWGLWAASIALAVATVIGLWWLVVAKGMRLGRNDDSQWRYQVRFAQPPTEALAVVPNTTPVSSLPESDPNKAGR